MSFLISDEFVVEGYGSSNHELVELSDGKLLAVWLQDHSIRCRVLDSDGKVMGDEYSRPLFSFDDINGRTEPFHGYNVAATPNGGFALVTVHGWSPQSEEGEQVVTTFTVFDDALANSSYEFIGPQESWDERGNEVNVPYLDDLAVTAAGDVVYAYAVREIRTEYQWSGDGSGPEELTEIIVEDRVDYVSFNLYGRPDRSSWNDYQGDSRSYQPGATIPELPIRGIDLVAIPGGVRLEVGAAGRLNPDQALLESGQTVTTWSANGTVFAQRYQSGSAVGDTITVGAGDRAYVTAVQNGFVVATAGYAIAYDALGAPIGEVINLDDGKSVDVASLRNGNFIISYSEDADFSWSAVIKAQRYGLDEGSENPLGDMNFAENRVTENAEVGTVVGVDVDVFGARADQPGVVYKIVGPSYGFSIDAQTGVVSVGGRVDYEKGATVSLRVEASSNLGLIAEKSFAIAINDVSHTKEGTAAAEKLTGTNEEDTIHGRGGGDTLHGYGGIDRLFGDDGNDRIYGGDGGDWIEGGLGNDSVYGQSGRDVFAFGKNFGTDRIADFAGGSGGDYLAFDRAVFRDAAAVFAAVEQIGADLVVRSGSNSVVLSNTLRSDLTGENLSFYGTGKAEVPTGSVVSTGASETIRGTVAADMFLFDTAVGEPLGNDVVKGFGSGDRLVFTSALSDPNNDGLVRLDASDRLLLPDALGSVKVFNTNGKAVSGFVLEDVAMHEGTSYYVYKAAGDVSGGAELFF